MLAARENLRPLLKLSKGGSNWRNDPKMYRSEGGLQGSVNLSPGWFQKGHEVSALANLNSILGNSFRIRK